VWRGERLRQLGRAPYHWQGALLDSRKAHTRTVLQIQFTESRRKKKKRNSFYEFWMTSQMCGWEFRSSGTWRSLYRRFKRNVDSEGRQIITQCLDIVLQNNKTIDNYLLQYSVKKTAIYIEFYVVVDGMIAGNMLPNCEAPTCHIKLSFTLTLNPLMWKIWWAPNNVSRWQMGFNSAFKGLTIIWAKYEFVEITAPNNINSQLDATVTHLIDNYNQLNMF